MVNLMRHECVDIHLKMAQGNQNVIWILKNLTSFNLTKRLKIHVYVHVDMHK